VVVDFLHANVLVWGGDVRHSEAHQVSGMLQNTTFPHLSLVMSGPSSRHAATLTLLHTCLTRPADHFC